eukprot:5657810-Prymnesium_polylepis.1
MCAYDLFTELLTTYGEKVTSSPEPEPEPEPVSVPSRKRKVDTPSNEPAKRSAVESPIQSPEKDSLSDDTEYVEYSEEDHFDSAIYNVFDGGIEADGVSGSFKFESKKVVFLESSK